MRILGSVWIVRSRLTYTHFRTHTLIISLFYQPTQSIPRSRSWPTSPYLMTITRTNTLKHCVCGSCCCETRLIETIFIQTCAIWGRRGAFPGLGLWEVSQSNHCQRTKLIDTFLMISQISMIFILEYLLIYIKYFHHRVSLQHWWHWWCSAWCWCCPRRSTWRLWWARDWDSPGIIY